MAEENSVQETPQFQVGETVVIREDFHSKYFQGLHATIAGPGREGVTKETLWPIKLDKPPHEMMIAGQYLRRPTETELSSGSASDSGEPDSKGSFLTRIIPWRRS